MPLADGAEFAGYTIERLLGAGGMGEVYLVRHPRLPRREALKILPANVSADPEFRQRFAREADIAASLWHHNIVAVHDRGDDDGQLWITMDFVEGTDAAQLVRERYPSGMPPNDVFDIVAAIADALDYAHQRHLLHRDVKPANILLTTPNVGDRRILLADFGIARAADDTNNLTATNMTIGSIPYSAPEQLMGKRLDGRADQYALACTAFHLLAGGPPFRDSNPAVVIGNHLSAPAPQLGRVRADLGRFDAVLATAMAKEPYQRFNSCREFAAALAQSDTAASGYGGAAAAGYGGATQYAHRPPPPIPTAAPIPTAVAPRSAPVIETSGNIKISRRGGLIAGGVAVLVAVGSVAFIGARLGQPDSETPTTSTTRSTIPGEPTFGPSPPQTATQTEPPVTVTQASPPPPATQSAPFGDLGLATPMTVPSCDGQGIVVLGNVVTPGTYTSGIQQLLNKFPGASYLRTDQSCPSLRQQDENGNTIYAVYRNAGTTQGEVCAAVRAAGGGSYGKWLDTTHDPHYIIPC